jgi:hypothetical protein
MLQIREERTYPLIHISRWHSLCAFHLHIFLSEEPKNRLPLKTLQEIHRIHIVSTNFPACLPVLQLQLQTGLETGDQDEPTGTCTPFRNWSAERDCCASKASDRSRPDKMNWMPQIRQIPVYSSKSDGLIRNHDSMPARAPGLTQPMVRSPTCFPSCLRNHWPTG